MIKFISIDKALGTGSEQLGATTLQGYIDSHMDRFAQPGQKINGQTSETGGTDKDAIIFFKQQKTIWAKGTFYECANNDSINALLAGYSKTGVSGNVAASDTILQALEKLEVKVDSKTSNTGTVTGVKMNGSTNNPTNGVVDLGTVITAHQDISGKADKSAAIGSLSLSMDNDYKITLSGSYVNGTTFTVSDVIDLPLESVVVSGSYSNTTKKVTLTLQNGSVVDFSVADLISGLQSEITTTNKLSSDLVDDTNNTHKFVSATEKTTWNNKQNALTFTSTPSSTNKVVTLNDVPSTLPANGGNATTVNNHSVNSDVPANAVFTDQSVTAVDNHYTPTADSNAQLTATISGTAGSYALNTEYTVLTGVKAQRDAKGHITGLTYTAQKIKDTNTTYTGSGGITVNNGTISLDWSEED